MRKYIVYERDRISDLELVNLEIKLESKGYDRLIDRGPFVVFGHITTTGG